MPSNIAQIATIILFIIPGFIFTRFVGFSVPFRSREVSGLILDSLAASCFNYAILSPLVWITLRENSPLSHPAAFVLSWLFILLVFPILLALLALKGMESKKFLWLRRAFRLTHPVPTAWDYFFRQGKSCWIMATLKDKKVIAGLYSTNSFASSYPDKQDLYLEKLCALSADGRMLGLLERSEGAIIPHFQFEIVEATIC